MNDVESTNGTWYRCTVKAAGPIEDGSVYIGLEGPPDHHFNHFFCPVEEANEPMLLVALGAMISGKQVDAVLESEEAESAIYRLYLVG
ncbi:hypothetical protein [Nocardia vaccinii]|uniref:hypothetical protein n=1 Tax=Nocardia vaccinii TaxID=1822 RepID=UPI000AA66FB3|nr:hypothetical protein [Nocardia vaccinii]